MGEERLSKDEAIAKAEAAWADWRRFMVGEAEAGRAERRGDDGWTLAEAAVHIARWQLWAGVRMRGVLTGERIERLDVDGRNAGWAQEDLGVRFPTALERADSAWTDLHKVAASIPEAKWRRMISAIFSANTWEHYEEHLGWRPGDP